MRQTSFSSDLIITVSMGMIYITYRDIQNKDNKVNNLGFIRSGANKEMTLQ